MHTRKLVFAATALATLQLISARPLPSQSPAPPKPAAASQYAEWRAQIRHALFIPDPLPALASHSYGTFTPAPGITAERISYATLYSLRVPAILYRPTQIHGRAPAIVVVNGHSGDKTSWYAYYAGILYARSGAVVLTYDPIGEDERNINRASETRAHDAFVPGPEMPPRLGGLMISDVMQAVSYVARRPDVDPARIAVVAYSMGTFHSAIAAALDTRIHALILSGGGNLSGDGDYWDVSPKVMCQSGPWKALRFLPDRGAAIYALNQQRGPTFVINGTADPLIVNPHTFQPFFDDLRNRTAAIRGTRTGLFENYWIEGAGHRPNFVTRPAALWLEDQLHFPNWTPASINALPEVHISEWAAKTGAHIGAGFATELGEGGVRALDVSVPAIPRDQLQALPDSEWQQHKSDYLYETWVEHAKAASAKSQ